MFWRRRGHRFSDEPARKSATRAIRTQQGLRWRRTFALAERGPVLLWDRLITERLRRGPVAPWRAKVGRQRPTLNRPLPDTCSFPSAFDWTNFAIVLLATSLAQRQSYS